MQITIRDMIKADEYYVGILIIVKPTRGFE